MSYPLDLDEIEEEKLREELTRRTELRLAGKCDYCGRLPTEPSCKFPERHHRKDFESGEEQSRLAYFEHVVATTEQELEVSLDRLTTAVMCLSELALKSCRNTGKDYYKELVVCAYRSLGITRTVEEITSSERAVAKAVLFHPLYVQERVT